MGIELPIRSMKYVMFIPYLLRWNYVGANGNWTANPVYDIERHKIELE